MLLLVKSYRMTSLLASNFLHSDFSWLFFLPDLLQVFFGLQVCTELSFHDCSGNTFENYNNEAVTPCLAACLLILAVSSAMNLWYVSCLEVKFVLGESILLWLSALSSSCFTSSQAAAILEEGTAVEQGSLGFGSGLAS